MVNERLAAIEDAYKNRDFPTFGEITMQDSNQFHATCLDTYPPIFYLNEVSRKIIGLVHAYNSHVGRVQAAYTFDAGPNAVIFLEEQHVQDVMALLLASFPSSTSHSPVEIRSSVAVDHDTVVDPALLAAVQPKSVAAAPLDADSIKMYYVSRVGGGTQVLGLDEALVDVATGEPILAAKTEDHEACGCFWARQIEENAWLPYAVAAGAFLSVAVATLTRKQ